MNTDPNEPNPYRSPPEVKTSDKPAKQKFPWRIIPTVLLYLYGGLIVAVVVLYFSFVEGCMVCRIHGHPASRDQIWVIHLVIFLHGLEGLFAIIAGRLVWKQRWKRSAIAFVIAVILMAVAYGIVAILPSMS